MASLEKSFISILFFIRLWWCWSSMRLFIHHLLP